MIARTQCCWAELTRLSSELHRTSLGKRFHGKSWCITSRRSRDTAQPQSLDKTQSQTAWQYDCNTAPSIDFAAAQRIRRAIAVAGKRASKNRWAAPNLPDASQSERECSELFRDAAASPKPRSTSARSAPAHRAESVVDDKRDRRKPSVAPERPADQSDAAPFHEPDPALPAAASSFGCATPYASSRRSSRERSAPTSSNKPTSRARRAMNSKQAAAIRFAVASTNALRQRPASERVHAQWGTIPILRDGEMP